MKNIFDELVENIVVIDEYEKIVFINKILYKQMGYKRDELDFDKLDEKIIINKDNVSLNCKNGTIIKAKCNLMKSEMTREGYKVGIIKHPILNDSENVEKIAISHKETTVEKSICSHVEKALKLCETKAIENQDIEVFKEEMFKELKLIFLKYFNSLCYNVWIYDENKKIIEALFDCEIFRQNPKIKKQYEFSIEKERYSYLDNASLLLNIHITKEKYNTESGKREYLYIQYYPIIYKEKFLGFLTMIYEDQSKLKIIESNLISTICQQLGIIVMNMRMHKNYKKGLKKRENIEYDFEEFLNKLDDITIKVNDKGEFIDVSAEWVKSLGWTKEETLKMNWKDLIHPDDLEQSIEVINNYKKYKIGRTLVSRHKSSNGTYKWLKWTRRIDKYDKDEKLYAVASAKDITLEKDLEEKELLMDKYKKLEVLRNEFFANLSHELRTPITMIMSIAQILEKNIILEKDINELRLKSEKYLSILKQNSYRLLRIINNLIDGTKIDSGFYKINLINANIVYIVEEIVMSVTEYCKMKNITLIFDTDEEEEIIACDPDQIERIMLNLLSNATKYTQEGGAIYVDLQVKKKHISISVKDTGEGISEEKINYIFDRFVQSNKKDENRVDGSGIGLSLVKSFVEMHDGNVSVESKKGEGSMFMFTLPRVKIDSEKTNNDSILEYDASRQERCHIEFSDIYKF